MVVCFVLLMSHVSWGTEVKCKKELTPELKEAYAQLKEAFKGVDGVKIGIRCLHDTKSDWTLKEDSQ